MAINYAWEKFHLAVLGLSRSTQSLQARLATAFIYHITHVDESGLTPSTWARIEDLSKALTATPIPTNKVSAITDAMSDEQAGKLIEEIVSLYDDITRQYAKSR